MTVSNTTRIFAIVTFIIYAVLCVVIGNVANRRAAKRAAGFGKNYFAGGACAFFMPVLFGVWWKRANKYGCIASMVVGIGYYLAATSVPALAFGMLPLVPALVLACVAMVVVSLATPAPDLETLDVWFGVGRSCVKENPAKA